MASNDVIHPIISPYHHPRIWILGARVRREDNPHTRNYSGGLPKTFPKRNWLSLFVCLWLSLSVYGSLRKVALVCKFFPRRLLINFYCFHRFNYIYIYFYFQQKDSGSKIALPSRLRSGPTNSPRTQPGSLIRVAVEILD